MVTGSQEVSKPVAAQRLRGLWIYGGNKKQTHRPQFIGVISMYIKYRDFNYSECEQIHVCAISHLCIMKSDCEDDHGIVAHGAIIQNRTQADTASMIDEMIDSLADYITDGESRYRCKAYDREPVPSLSDFYEDKGWLMWFSSVEAAQKVFNDICKAMADGKQYFDLTQYGEDGVHL